MKRDEIGVDRSVINFRRLALPAAILVYLVIVLGGVVRSTGGGCDRWPACHEGLQFPLDPAALAGGLHGLGVFLLAPLLAALAFFAWRRFHQVRLISLPLYGALALLILQIAWGGAVAAQTAVETRQPLTAVHLGLSLIIQALVATPAVAAFYMSSTSGSRLPRIKPFSPFGRLSLMAAGSVFVLLVSGALVAATGSQQACQGWPLCGGALLPTSLNEWINMSHRLVAALAGALVIAQLVQAWRTQRSQTPVLVASTTVGVLFFSQALMGALKVSQGFPMYMLGLHEASAAAVWAVLVVQVTAVGLSGRTAQEERLEAAGTVGRKGLARDFLMLTKPVVVALLLVTTFAGMVVGARAWPSLSLVFWTLLGGAMAAGGSGAVNQYIDRFDDLKMQRTERRPIPSGRLTPGEGLAFGVGISLAAFYLTAAFVNLLAALLVLAGIIYYVLIYSIFLKKTTVQNIVIGGGAGAIPPLVGWAAATGSLNVPSLFLFAVVFMWTPPHFWALALVRRKDYARAGVPMLPVVRGERETRWQIFIYTVELVALTLLLPLFGLGGSLYLVSAGVLGGMLLLSAWKVWRQGGNKLAWKMYRHSSMYLAFLFLALVVDALL